MPSQKMSEIPSHHFLVYLDLMSPEEEAKETEFVCFFFFHFRKAGVLEIFYSGMSAVMVGTLKGSFFCLFVFLDLFI